MKLRLRFAVIGVSGFLWCVGCGADPERSDPGAAGVPASASAGSPGLNGVGGAIAQTSGGSAAAERGGAGAGGAPFVVGGAGGRPTLGGAGGIAGAAGVGGAMAGSSGATSAGAPAAGASGSAGAGGAAVSGDDPCAGGMLALASDKGSTSKAVGYGDVEFISATSNQITSLETTLAVPKKPPPSGTIFLWPGLEPLTSSAHYNPVGIGVLQPVLTWGGTCAPGAPNDYKSWWISAQYVGNPSSDAAHTGCHGGDGMTVDEGDELHIVMSLKGTIWSQTVIDNKSAKQVTFDIDMLGQAQNWVIYEIETPTAQKPISDVVFTNTTITFANKEPAAHCTPSNRGTNDFFSAPRASVDGMKCCVAKIILRAQGVAATEPNM
jgi:hypothetical protein